MKRINLLVCGYGNIAKRHISNFSSLFEIDTLAVVRHSKSTDRMPHLSVERWCFFTDLESALLKSNFDYAIICSPASMHTEHTIQTTSYGIPTFVEKPISDSYHSALELYAHILSSNTPALCGYPLVKTKGFAKFRECLSKFSLENIWKVEVEVGQYLPDWRPNKEYQLSVSAQRKYGGGAMRELSHEIDYFLALFDFDNIAFNSVKYTHSSLPMDCENVSHFIGLGTCAAHQFMFSISQNFLMKTPKRYCRIYHTHGVLTWDIIEQSIIIQDNRDGIEIVDVSEPLNDAYIKLIETLIKAQTVGENITSIKRGIDTIRIIESADNNKLREIKISS